jgi:aminoglycoside phosphotransferase (APT) family kinase protein
MEFIARHTHIPIPRVHDVFIIDSQTYIVMDYIDAPELTQIWNKLTVVHKKRIFAHLKDYIAQMRSLEPSPPGQIQAADGTGLFDSRLCLDNRPIGPFASVGEFHTYLGHDCIRTLEQHRQCWPQLKAVAEKQYRTVFCHSDISPRNVLARDGEILGVIDWECAGWYPE